MKNSTETKMKNVIVKITPELTKEIRARVKTIKKEKNQTPFDTFAVLFPIAHRAVNNELFYSYHTGKVTCQAALEKHYVKRMAELIATDDHDWFYDFARELAAQKEEFLENLTIC